MTSRVWHVALWSLPSSLDSLWPASSLSPPLPPTSPLLFSFFLPILLPFSRCRAPHSLSAVQSLDCQIFQFPGSCELSKSWLMVLWCRLPVEPNESLCSSFFVFVSCLLFWSSFPQRPVRSAVERSINSRTKWALLHRG